MFSSQLTVSWVINDQQVSIDDLKLFSVECRMRHWNEHIQLQSYVAFDVDCVNAREIVFY